MNKARRAVIAKVRGMIEAAQAIVDEAAEMLEFERDGERETFENMPESLQGSERGEAINQAADALESAVEDIGGWDFEAVLNNLELASE